jgi:hypothetical protein
MAIKGEFGLPAASLARTPAPSTRTSPRVALSDLDGETSPTTAKNLAK